MTRIPHLPVTPALFLCLCLVGCGHVHEPQKGKIIAIKTAVEFVTVKTMDGRIFRVSTLSANPGEIGDEITVDTKGDRCWEIGQ